MVARELIRVDEDNWRAPCAPWPKGVACLGHNSETGVFDQETITGTLDNRDVFEQRATVVAVTLSDLPTHFIHSQ